MLLTKIIDRSDLDEYLMFKWEIERVLNETQIEIKRNSEDPEVKSLEFLEQKYYKIKRRAFNYYKKLKVGSEEELEDLEHVKNKYSKQLSEIIDELT